MHAERIMSIENGKKTTTVCPRNNRNPLWELIIKRLVEQYDECYFSELIFNDMVFNDTVFNDMIFNDSHNRYL